MPRQNDPITIPIYGPEPHMSNPIPVDLPPGIASQLQTHALNGAQRMADGAGHYAENLRYDYLEGKDGVSAAEAVGERRMDESGSGRARDLSGNPPANRAV